MTPRSLPRLRFAPALAGLSLLALSATPANAQEPNFGRALALSESTLVVGQPVNWYGPGMVYVYEATGGDWGDPITLAAPDSSRMDDFGRALALDGTTLAVAAPRKRDGSGVVYLYRGDSAGAWSLEAVVEPDMEGDHGEFGAALALDGDDLLIGSPAAEGSGVVHHYRRSGSEWSWTTTLRPADPLEGSSFGSSMAQDGDRLLIGAPSASNRQGGVYASVRSGASWSEPQPVAFPGGDLPQRAGAGSAVEVSGDRAWVGVPGAGVVFQLEERTPGEWVVASTLQPHDAPARSSFGSSLASDGADLWVGAPGIDGGYGRVYRYQGDGAGGWRTVVRMDPDDVGGRSWPLGFGYSVAVAGERAVVGMPSRDFGEGRVMALSREVDDWESADILEGRIFRIGSELSTGALCEDGRMTEFPCTNLELVAHMPISDLGGERGVWVNDVWGWTDPADGRDYALIARRDGASFVDVTEPSAPRLVGNLPRTEGSRPSVWRDIKVIGTTAYIVSDGAGAHGMQVFDLTRLRDVGAEPVDFEPDLTYDHMASAHNVVADTATGYLYIVGANSGGETCGGGLHIVDANDPLAPAFAGCYHDTGSPGSRGYTHDAQCLVYEGPDEDYRGRELCIGSNESEINIADVTDKASPVTISRMGYPDVAYAHQGWFDEEQRYFYMNDEADELAGTVDGTRTIVWDLTDLDDPVVANQYIGPVRASDHNLYVVGDYMYQSNYGSGLRVIDIGNRENPVEIAYFDSAPYNEDGPGHSAGQSGAWSNYPFFGDGLVIFTSVREGLFIMRVRPPIS